MKEYLLFLQKAIPFLPERITDHEGNLCLLKKEALKLLETNKMTKNKDGTPRKRRTSTKTKIDMSDCPHTPHSSAYRTEYTRRRRAYLKANGLTVHGTAPKRGQYNAKDPKAKPKAKPSPLPVAKDKVCCIPHCDTQIERAVDEKVLNGTVFNRTTKDGRSLRVFACSDCL